MSVELLSDFDLADFVATQAIMDAASSAEKRGKGGLINCTSGSPGPAWRCTLLADVLQAQQHALRAPLHPLPPPTPPCPAAIKQGTAQIVCFQTGLRGCLLQHLSSALAAMDAATDAGTDAASTSRRVMRLCFRNLEVMVRVQGLGMLRLHARMGSGPPCLPLLKDASPPRGHTQPPPPC